MSSVSSKDMTIGSPMKLILSFAVPLLLGLLFQQFYNMADTIIVGRLLGLDALSGVGATGSINFMIIGFCMGVCAGFSIPVAQKFGAKDYNSLREFVANSVWLAVCISIVMTVLVAFFCKDILILMKTPSDIFDYSYSYIIVIFLGIPACYLYNLLSGIIRALGDSKTPLFFLIISSFLNIALDLILIAIFKMGVMGASLATVISQAVSGFLCLIFIIKKYEILHISKPEWAINLSKIGTLCSIGIPMGLQYSVTAIGSVVLQTAVNSLGSVAVASMTTAGKVSIFFCCPFDALGSTMATYGGQNVGAKKLSRINQGLKDCIILGIIYSAIAFVLLQLFGVPLIKLFAEEISDELIKNAKMLLLYNSIFYIPLALVNIFRFLIQGMGFSAFAILAGVFEMIARVIAGIILVPVLGFQGACLASPLAWILADLFLVPAFIYVRNKLAITFKIFEEKN